MSALPPTPTQAPTQAPTPAPEAGAVPALSQPVTRLRVAQVTAAYPPHLGGLERVVQAVSRELARQGCDVRVLTTDHGAAGAPRRERVDGVRVRRYRAAFLAHTPIAPGLLWGLLRLPRGTVVHAHVAHALTAELVRLACLVRGFASVVHVHLDVEASGPAGRLLPLYKRLVQAPALRRADRVIALTDSMATTLRERYGVAADRIRVLRNGVDPIFFGSTEQSSAHDGALRLLFASRLAPQKNLPRLLRALATVAQRGVVDVELVVVGDGEDRADLERLTVDLGLRGVRFVGTESAEQVAARMADADVLVLPSDAEGMPLVVLEAMATGLPVLATDVPGTRELVDGVGLLVPADEAGLAEGITALAGDPGLRRDLAERGRAKAAEHAWPEICAELLDVLTEAGAAR